jgi:hypothetical protein
MAGREIGKECRYGFLMVYKRDAAFFGNFSENGGSVEC